MAPSGSTTTRRRPTRKPRRKYFKKKLVQPKNQKASRSLPSNSSTTTSFNSKISDLTSEGVEVELTSSGCSTPKAQRFKIPEILTCPPAPKKQRVVSNCSLQRSPIAFFAPPDLELFFFFALRDISV
ncbi:cyclin-dependent protein kinase inhibitor SMR9-like [Quercus robur]|uniref:Cyclin-dependent protein kinase inhibitor SMR13 n=1 Tax=Quercus lobata TaxID=97700 RepID=A0A7N2KKU1_QUELO|nr:cyclin-dependent protein kinase inhibitor SMR9-like [Quercus robur]